VTLDDQFCTDVPLKACTQRLLN